MASLGNALSLIWQGLKEFFTACVNLVTKIIKGIFEFSKEILGYFQALVLDRRKHTPFIADANDPRFKEMLRNAPVKNVGIFEGVYNEETEQIENTRMVEADELDKKTKDILGKEPLVVLQ